MDNANNRLGTATMPFEEPNLEINPNISYPYAVKSPIKTQVLALF
jgi:hypothetical protein